MYSADDMGLGKTLTMISLILKQRTDEILATEAAGHKSTDSSSSSAWLSTGHKGETFYDIFSRLYSCTTAAASAHSSKTAPFGTDGRLPRHVQSPTYVRLPRTSTSHLATDPRSRPSSVQPPTQLSMVTCPG